MLVHTNSTFYASPACSLEMKNTPGTAKFVGFFDLGFFFQTGNIPFQKTSADCLSAYVLSA